MRKLIKRTARRNRFSALLLLGALLVLTVAVFGGASWVGAAFGGPTTPPPTIAGTIASPSTTQDLYAIGGSDTSHLWTVGANATILSDVSGAPNFTAETSAVAAPAGLNAVGAVSSSTAWAVGAGCSLEITTDGTNWTQVASPAGCPAGTNLTGIDIGGNSSGWAVGSGGVILVCSANCGKATATWSMLASSPTAQNLNAVGATSNGSAVWAVGANDTVVYCASSCASAAAVFHQISPTALAGYTLTGVATSDGSEAWITGSSGGVGVIAQCASAAACTSASGPWNLTATTAPMSAVSAASTSLVYAVGGNGAAYACVSSCGMASAIFSPLSGTGAGGTNLTGVYVRDTNDVDLVGLGGFIAACSSNCTPGSGSVWSVPPANPSYVQTASFTFSDPVAATFSCSLDNNPYAACSSPYSTSALTVGNHTLKVEAISGAGTSQATQYSWTVSAPLTPTLTATPPNPLNSSVATFSYADAYTGATFACQMDGGGFSSCPGTGSGTATFSDLTPGMHVFKVEALSGGLSSSATSVSFTVVTPPVPTITGGPCDPAPAGCSTVAASAKFTYTEPVGTSYVSGYQTMEGDVKATAGDWISVGWHFTYPGTHPSSTVTFQNSTFTFPVTCVDGSTPTQSTWVIHVTPDQTYTDPANSSAWIPWSSQQVASSFQAAAQIPALCGTTAGNIHLDKGSSFATTISANDTTHSLNLQYHYRDPNAKGKGNVDCMDPAQNPDPGNSAVCGAGMSGTATVTPGMGSSSVTFECSIDSTTAFTPCGSGASGMTLYPGLPPGTHTFRVRAVSGGVASASAKYTWTIQALTQLTLSGDASGKLYPGGTAVPVPVKFANPNSVDVSITSFTIPPTSIPPSCPATASDFVIDYGLTPISATNPLVVPANNSVTLGTTPSASNVSEPTIKLKDNGDQTACHGATFTLSYTASGTGTGGGAASGVGAGSAQIGSVINPFTVSIGTATGGLLLPTSLTDPNRTVDLVPVTVTNADPAAENLHSLTYAIKTGWSHTDLAGDPPCTASDFSIDGLTPGTAHTQVYDDDLPPGGQVTHHFRIQMVDNGHDQDSCAGQKPSITVSAN